MSEPAYSPRLRTALVLTGTGTSGAYHAGVLKALGEAGVQTIIHYPIPPHLQQAYADLGCSRGRFPIAEQLAGEVLSIPVGPHMTEEQVEAVIAAIRA